MSSPTVEQHVLFGGGGVPPEPSVICIWPVHHSYMSVDVQNRRNKAVLIALIAGTVAMLAIGLSWLQSQGTTFIEELAYAILVVLAALFLYDKLLVM